MTETSIRDLMARAVEDGPPSGIQLPVDDVLARNARMLRRRRIGQALVAVVLLAGAAGLSALLPGRPPSALPPPAPAATGPLVVTPTPPIDLESRAKAALGLLVAAAPPGYRVQKGETAPGPGGSTYAVRETSWRGPERPFKELYWALLEVQLDGRAAVLTVRVTDQVPVNLLSAADPCAVRINPDEQSCRVVPASDNTPVRIASWHPVTGPVDEATRVVNGVLVTVQQAGRPRPNVYALGRPVLDDRQLADLTTNPTLLP
ncbi:hypothetical protein [Micromonospora sp. NBC_01796]|uniref:hypothetical protein n=1 Tax=Micromonospora sp. NBC_01796 TaxID=2975987 RepID=UPI002DDB4531|nr:hypothetical protein [Micromonospora sp. NBC_01796]WSA88123.1 hypothetical protein OIE47_11195 [Micromonospora sp. NBC_01796]